MNEYRGLYNAGDVIGKLVANGPSRLLGVAAPGAAPDPNAITITQSDLGLNGSPTNLNSSTIGSLLGTVYLIAGIVAVVVMVIGGIRYTTSNGDSGQIQSAKNTIFYAVIGLVVIILASAITQFIISGVSGSSTS